MKENEVITIGIDASTTHCGMAIYKNGLLQEVLEKDFDGTFDTKKLRTIVNYFEYFFSEYNPQIILIEEPINVRNARSAMALNQVAGAIFAVGTMYNAYCDYVHNRTIKKIRNIKTKEDSIREAKKIKRLEYTEHQADAVNIVEAYKSIVNDSQKCFYA